MKLLATEPAETEYSRAQMKLNLNYKCTDAHRLCIHGQRFGFDDGHIGRALAEGLYYVGTDSA